MQTIAHSANSIEHICLLLKESINIYVVDLIVGGSLFIVPVFWMGDIYSNLTMHSIVLILFETALTTLIYLAYFDDVFRDC